MASKWNFIFMVAWVVIGAAWLIQGELVPGLLAVIIANLVIANDGIEQIVGRR